MQRQRMYVILRGGLCGVKNQCRHNPVSTGRARRGGGGRRKLGNVRRVSFCGGSQKRTLTKGLDGLP